MGGERANIKEWERVLTNIFSLRDALHTGVLQRGAGPDRKRIYTMLYSDRIEFFPDSNHAAVGMGRIGCISAGDVHKITRSAGGFVLALFKVSHVTILFHVMSYAVCCFTVGIP